MSADVLPNANALLYGRPVAAAGQLYHVRAESESLCFGDDQPLLRHDRPINFSEIVMRCLAYEALGCP